MQPHESQGEQQASLGLEQFRLEKYEQAARHYEEAVRSDPANFAWRKMLSTAQANAVAQIQIVVPPAVYFEAEKLLTPASAIPDQLPQSVPPRKVIWAERVRRRTGRVLGIVATFLTNLTTTVWGRLAGYRDRIWTNWYRRSKTLGILTLAHMRNQLNKNNLKTTYPEGALTGFQKPGQTPPPGVAQFRTADGSWNNLANPKEGAAGTRFLRNVNTDAIQPESGARLMTPNPREISRKLLTRMDGKMKEVPFLNLLAAAWIQFENHDWVNHGEPLTHSHGYRIPIPDGDPLRVQYDQATLPVGKTQADPTWMHLGREETPVAYINEVTHWWDGSQIYGSDCETQHRLRSFVDGKLRVNADGTLPIDELGVEDTGFRRNWWIGLTILHTLFVREHNAICDHLKLSYPHWDDNRTFNVARLINAAVMAKIHTVEWTPAILPNPGLNSALNANWYGILSNLFEYGKERQAVSEIKIRNPELGGVVANPIDKHGQPYGLTEEFTEVYRLHSLLPESLQLRRRGEDAIEEVAVPATRQAGSVNLTGRYGIGDILYSFGRQHPGALELNNFPRFMQELSIPGNPLFDMGAVDILRARERGVPRYNSFRRQLGLNPIGSFSDLTDDQEQVKKLEDVYGGDVEQLDLLIGTLSEGHRPTNFGFGETMFQIFILNATRRLQSDRFYTDCYNADTYTSEGLDWIDHSSFKTVLLRHYPELARTGLANVTNAFEPWDTEERLDQTRHPLRAYDRELQPDPWLGSAHR